MAYVITISDKTLKGELAIGDVVAIQDIRPSPKEYEVFTVTEIDDKLTQKHGEGSWKKGSTSGVPKIIPGGV